jgi:hypothetical protein
MIEVNRWLERKFRLDLPISLYPNVVERLRGVPARLEDHLIDLPAEILTWKRAQDWSIQEHAGHLLDLEPLNTGRLDDFEQRLASLRAADLENKKTYEANHNQRSIQDLLAEFRKERLAFVQRLEGYDEPFVSRSALHPRLQLQMRVIDLSFFIAEHDDHHLTTIASMIRHSPWA